MIPYKTNSAAYLDYVANTLSRQQILADQDLCLLLENPYIKENMEVAIKWNDAKYGDYKDKYDFVEYYLCNGPELDADTLLHYRNKALADPVVMEIAYSYFTDTNALSKIRQEKYGKPNDGNCFTNPCFYLGDFSPLMGSLGDFEDVDNGFNRLGVWIAEKTQIERNTVEGRKNAAEVKRLRGQITEAQKAKELARVQAAALAAAQAAQKKDPNAITPDGNAALNGQGGTRPTSVAHSGHVRVQYLKGWDELGKAIFDSQVQFCTAQWDARIRHDVLGVFGKIGDWASKKYKEELNIIDKANMWRQMGDCARLWSQARRFKIYSSDNKFGPQSVSQIVGNTAPDGQPLQPVPVPNPVPAQATQPLKIVVEKFEK